MTFLHAGLAIAGVACIAIPIIIHLLMHRRRKPVMWGAMRFLLEAYRRQRRRLMLEKWLLLACRCLILALLGLAIGRPLLGRLGGDRGGRTLYLLIDNGMTSGLKSDADGGKTALQRHKESAKAAINTLRDARMGVGTSNLGLGEGDRVGLISLGGPADAMVIPPSPNLASIAQLIDDVQATDSRTDIAGAMRLIAEAMSRAGSSDGAGASASDPARTYVAVFSDFREGSLELSGSGTGSESNMMAGVRLPAGVKLLASTPDNATAAANVAIVGVEPLRSVVVGESGDGEGAADLVRVQLRRSGSDLPGATTTLQTRVISASSESLAPLPGERSGAGEAVGKTVVRWASGQESAMVVATIPRARGVAGATVGRASGSGLIVASIDNDPLMADNVWRRPIEFREALRVGVVGPTRFSDAAADKLDPASWTRLALSPTGDRVGSGIDVVDIDPASIDAARLAGLDAVVLPRPDLLQDSSWARIGLFLSSGGVVVVAPPPAMTVHLWTDAMSKGLGLPAEWNLPRESRAVTDGRLIAPAPTSQNPGGDGAAGGGGVGGGGSSSSTPDTSSPDLLALVRGELDELVRPVTVRAALPLENTGESGKVLLRLENGPAIMWAGRPSGAGVGGGVGVRGGEPGLLVYLGVALSLDWSDLPAKPLMVPLLQETIRQGVGQARGSWWSVAGSRPVAPQRTVELREIATTGASGSDKPDRQSGTGVVSIDETGTVSQALRHAGAFAARDELGTIRALVAVNPDARASRIAPQTQQAVGELLATAVVEPGGSRTAPSAGAGSGTVDAIVWMGSEAGTPIASTTPAEGVQRTLAGLFSSGQRGAPIDLPLLIGALLFAVVEILLARRASHADIATSTRSIAAAGLANDGGRVTA